MSSTQLTLLLSALLAAAGIGTALNHRTTTRLRAENFALRRQVASLANVSAENQRLSNRLNAANRPGLPTAEQRELLKLRGEVSALRRQTNDLAKIQQENQQLRSAASPLPGRDPSQTPADYLSRETWAFVGYADPDAALQSTLWAWSSGDPTAIVGSFTPAHRASWGFKTDEEIAARLSNNIRNLKGIQVLERKQVSDTETRLVVGDPGGKFKLGFCYKRIGTEWKFDAEFKAN